MHLPTLISDLAVILLAAGIITLLFKMIKQPVVLGYIIAGIIAGPALHLFKISNIDNIRIWADIGVIFLLFSLGLDFSFKKLFNTGKTAFITAFTIVIGMMVMGYLTGKALGWTHMNCLFLGAMLAMSSTTIIIKSFDDLGIRNQLFAGLVIGILIVEDLVAVILMVVLGTIAKTNQIEGADLVLNVLRMAMFVLIWFVCGIYLLPTFLKKSKKWMNDETMLVVTLALCLGMVLLATEIGFSAALGAFVMGSLLAETVEAERIEHLTRPVKDFFGAIFFVSVGMMIDPAGIASGWVSILVITAVVIVGQISFGTFGMILSGQPLKVSIQSGFSLAQIGEFAFIIATLGLSLKVIDPHIYPIIVAVSVITTFFTPFFIKSAIPAYNYIHKKMPTHWARAIQRLTAPPTLINRQSEWYELLRDLIRVMLVYLAITVTIMFVGFIYLMPFLQQWQLGISANIVGALIIIVAMAPFLRAMMIKRNNTIKNFIGNRDISIGPLVTIIVGRILLCVFLVMLVLAKLFDLGFLIDALIATATVVLILFSSWIKKGSINIEKRFLTNLTERQIREDKNKPMKKEFVKHLLSRDIHLADFEVQTHSPFVGKQLKDLRIREDYGVNIVSIVRGNARIHIPKGNEMIFPHDRIVVAGTDQQMMRFNYRMEECAINEEEIEQKDVVLEQLLLEENSPLIGKTIRSSKIRENYGCMIIGIERPHKYLMNPESSEELKTSDILWLVGEKQKILQLVEQKQ